MIIKQLQTKTSLERKHHQNHQRINKTAAFSHIPDTKVSALHALSHLILTPPCETYSIMPILMIIQPQKELAQ